MATGGYTVKELVQELRLESRASVATQAAMLNSLENIDRHLTELNSKVATHEQKINNLGTFQTKVMTVWGVSIAVVTTVISRIV
jgi:hypothetical protein